VLLSLIPALLLAVPAAPAAALSLKNETYQLDNGLTVILHEDHSLPQVVVDTWYGVGSKDEVEGRTGFAHLFEHLMFMGTGRLPGSGFDDLMEAKGGWNNAWTSEDETNYYDVGTSEMLDLLLWMEADRMDGLGKAMTQDKLDLQRDVVRNERRQTSEDQPYGEAWLEMPAALFPAGHPYAHSVIGSHEDLQAASVDDVKQFFATWYVPNNARLVVAGDFDPAQAKATIQRYFGPIERVELPQRSDHAQPDRPVVSELSLTDQVALPATILMWHSARVLTDDDAALDMLSTILSQGRSSRLYDRFVHSEGRANTIEAAQMSSMLGSEFMVFTLANPGEDLVALQDDIQAELDRMAAEGPTDAELERARNALETGYIQDMESLRSRATALARYHYLKGDPDWLAQDMARYAGVSAEDIQGAAASLSADRRLTIHVLPEEDAEEDPAVGADEASTPEGGAQ